MLLKTNPATHAEEIEVDGQWFTSDDDLGCMSMMSSAFLAAIAQGKLDTPRLAREMLAHRGHDETGRWVGFDAAKAALDRLPPGPVAIPELAADLAAIRAVIADAEAEEADDDPLPPGACPACRMVGQHKLQCDYRAERPARMAANTSTHEVFNADGRAVKVTVPEDDR